MAKEFNFRGKSIEEIQKLSIDEFAQIITSRERRKIKRGFTVAEKRLLVSVRKGEKDIKTHVRDMVILPEMVGKTFKVHNGKEWVMLRVEADMMGHRLGEFALTRKSIKHSSPGIGATRSSASLSVR